MIAIQRYDSAIRTLEAVWYGASLDGKLGWEAQDAFIKNVWYLLKNGLP